METILGQADSTGRKHLLHLQNIGFIVDRKGKITKAWVNYYNRPLSREVVKILLETPWTPAKKDGWPAVSRQDLYVNIYLTKAAIKKHGSWPSFLERIFP